MIGRTWHAIATREGAKRYAAHFHGSVVPALRRLDGFRRAYLLRRDTGGISGEVEIETLTIWTSMEAVSSFAGADADRAVVEPEARAAVLSYDSHVRHFTLDEVDA